MDTTNNTQDKTDIAIEYIAAEARFVYLRGEIDAGLAGGMAPDEVYTTFGDISADEQQRWVDVAKHLSKIITGA